MPPYTCTHAHVHAVHAPYASNLFVPQIKTEKIFSTMQVFQGYLNIFFQFYESCCVQFWLQLSRFLDL